MERIEVHNGVAFVRCKTFPAMEAAVAILSSLPHREKDRREALKEIAAELGCEGNIDAAMELSGSPYREQGWSDVATELAGRQVERPVADAAVNAVLMRRALPFMEAALASGQDALIRMEWVDTVVPVRFAGVDVPERLVLVNQGLSTQVYGLAEEWGL